MDFIWSLVAMPVIALLFASYLIFRDEQTREPNRITSPSLTALQPMANSTAYPSQRREIKWISRKEYETLVHYCDDVIVIDLSPQSSNARVPFCRTLSVSPGQALGMLNWIPPETSVVLHGASDTEALLLWTKHDIPGIAPIFMMTEVPTHTEIVRDAA